MLNKKPIFVVGFERGGTGILLNLLLSHPKVCKPEGETHEVFRGSRKIFPAEPLFIYLKKILKYLPILITQKSDVMSIHLWETRREFSLKTMDRIDKIFYYSKLKAIGPTQNLFKNENETYTFEELRNCRIICKNLNGLIFLSENFYEMYRDATFIAIIRNGFALGAGHPLLKLLNCMRKDARR